MLDRGSRNALLTIFTPGPLHRAKFRLQLLQESLNFSQNTSPPHFVQCNVYGVQCTMYNVKCTVYSEQFTVYSVQGTVYNVQCTVHR